MPHKRRDYMEQMGKARGTELIKIFMSIRMRYILRESHLHATIYDMRKYTWERTTALHYLLI